MTIEKIEQMFYEAIEEKAVYHKLEGVSEDKVYNWRKRRLKKPPIGDMMYILFQLGKIKITANEPDRPTNRNVKPDTGTPLHQEGDAANGSRH